MLDEGRGAFMDPHKYHEALSKIFWSVLDEEAKPEDALAEAKRLRDEMMAREANAE